MFFDLYEVTGNIIDRINDIPRSDANINTLTFAINKLSDMREQIVDYLEETFITKTYMENAIYYNSCLAVLEGIDRIILKINKDMNKEDGSDNK